MHCQDTVDDCKETSSPYLKKKKKKKKDANVTYSGCEYHFRDMPLHISDCKGVLSQGHVAFLKM